MEPFYYDCFSFLFLPRYILINPHQMPGTHGKHCKKCVGKPISARKSLSGSHTGSHRCYCCVGDMDGGERTECCVWTSDSYSDGLILFSVSVLHSLTFLSNPFSQSQYLSKAWVVWPASQGDKIKFFPFMDTAAASIRMHILTSMFKVHVC